ncbi:MAG: MBL fold metallo-hydrolase, partial [Pelagibacterales bacterium]|nr:MBL fold metallo-hydrolase [Pelagibacterales bacterium]
MKIHNFYDKETATFTYIVIDESSKKCAVIDSVLNYDIFSGKTNNASADLVINYIKENDLELEWILETHIHADHLTAASYIKEKLGGKIAIGSSITKVLEFWVPFFNTSHDTPTDGSQFDKLFDDGEKFFIGSLEVKVIHTPGHTPACVSYLVGDSIFSGDAIFTPQIGTARTDFPGGSAKTLYGSIKKILNLSENT